MGTAVIVGMIAASLIAIFLIPVSFYVVERFSRRRQENEVAAQRRHRRRDERRNLTMKQRIELTKRDVKRRWLAASLTILLGGCMVGPDYQRPPVTTPDVFRGSPTPTPDAHSFADLKWFEVFQTNSSRN